MIAPNSFGVLFGAIGLGFLTYGKRQKAIVPLVVGIALLLFPYFISNVLIILAVGIVLIVVPYFVRV
jgi:predicted membrane protein